MRAREIIVAVAITLPANLQKAYKMYCEYIMVQMFPGMQDAYDYREWLKDDSKREFEEAYTEGYLDDEIKQAIKLEECVSALQRITNKNIILK